MRARPALDGIPASPSGLLRVWYARGRADVSGRGQARSVTWLGRKQFYMWKVKDAPLSPTIRGELPGVAGYVWKSGATGELRAALANLSGEPHTVRFVHEGREYRVALAPRELKMQDL